MKLTLKRTLELCYGIWRDLAQSGADKSSVLWNDFKNGCPCCEYVDQRYAEYYSNGEEKRSLKCAKCPLNALFTKDFKSELEESDKDRLPCEYNLNSPYRKWADAPVGSDIRNSYAQEIADECERLLNKMEKSKKKVRRIKA